MPILLICFKPCLVICYNTPLVFVATIIVVGVVVFPVQWFVKFAHACVAKPHSHIETWRALVPAHAFVYVRVHLARLVHVWYLCAPLVCPYVGVVLSFYHLSHILNFNNFFRIGETRMPLECRKFAESNNDKKMPDPGAATKLTLSKSSRSQGESQRKFDDA